MCLAVSVRNDLMFGGWLFSDLDVGAWSFSDAWSLEFGAFRTVIPPNLPCCESFPASL
jgi:hypothetical protein